MVRGYISGGTVYARFGYTSLGAGISASDATYAQGSFGFRCSWDIKHDWVDARPAHTVICTGLPAGSSVVCSDGTTPASADTAAGTATVDCGAVLFPLASVTVYSSTGGGGDVLVALDTGDYADMGGGDSFEYAADAGGWLGPIVGSRIVNGSRIVRGLSW
jgi:hypothetical protein